jgi:hypothetical protein
MTFSERIYGLMLRAYPRAYRRRYAEPMQQLFRDRLRATQTSGELAALWFHMLGDWAVSVPKQYWQGSHNPGRRCIFFACYEAHSFSRHEIALEHLLLGILRQEPSLVTDPDVVVRAIESQEPNRRRFVRAKDLRLSRETARVWQSAVAAAEESGREVSPRDLSAAILRESDSFAARLLREHQS